MTPSLPWWEGPQLQLHRDLLGWSEGTVGISPHPLVTSSHVSLPLNRASYIAGRRLGEGMGRHGHSTLSDFLLLPLSSSRTEANSGDPQGEPPVLLVLLRSPFLGAAVPVTARCHLAGHFHPVHFHFCFSASPALSLPESLINPIQHFHSIFWKASFLA